MRGFTLIELLVVIAIIAILSVVIILTLNPAELLRQARDSNRVSDLATVRSAVSLYLADVSSASIGVVGTAYFSTAGSSTATNTSSSWGMASAVTSTAPIATTTRTVNGSGWLPVNLTAITSGPPIGSLPIDPVNASGTSITYSSGTAIGTFYGYVARPASTTFKFVTHMESQRYGSGGVNDKQTGDGGVSVTAFEQGTDLTL